MTKGIGEKTARPETRWGFPREAWEAAKAQTEDILIDRARRRETITYSGLCEAVSAIRLRPYSCALMALLDEACAEEDAAHGTILASLVVRKGGEGMPGAGYFRCAERLGRDVRDQRAFWEDELAKVYACWSQEER